jgi:amino acid transporter
MPSPRRTLGETCWPSFLRAAAPRRLHTVAVAIAILLVTVAFSYQTVRAYPNGGGSYTVARENLGTIPGLTAAAALIVDYILTVAVSVSAGIAAITSAVPELFDERVLLGLLCVWIIVLGNLRGVRESGSIFAVPTYFS